MCGKNSIDCIVREYKIVIRIRDFRKLKSLKKKGNVFNMLQLKTKLKGKPLMSVVFQNIGINKAKSSASKTSISSKPNNCKVKDIDNACKGNLATYF